MIHKCEVVSSNEWTGDCGKRARFKIVDYECGNEDGDYESFWVCDDCIKYFIDKNENNPHYILLDVKSLR